MDRSISMLDVRYGRDGVNFYFARRIPDSSDLTKGKTMPFNIKCWSKFSSFARLHMTLASFSQITGELALDWCTVVDSFFLLATNEVFFSSSYIIYPRLSRASWLDSMWQILDTSKQFPYVPLLYFTPASDVDLTGIKWMVASPNLLVFTKRLH